MDRPRLHPIWGYTLAVGLLAFTTATIMLAPYVTPAAPGRITGVLFRDGVSSAQSISAVIAADPTVRLVDLRLGGQLIFLVYHHADFPARIARRGAVRSFDAIAAGCHVTGQATALVRLGP